MKKITPLKYKKRTPTKKVSPLKAVEDVNYWELFYNPVGFLQDLNKSSTPEPLETKLQDYIKDIGDISTENLFEDLQNPFAGLKNPYARLKNRFENLQNVAEDLTVDQRAFRSQKQQSDESYALMLQQQREAGITGGLTQLILQQRQKDQLAVTSEISKQEQANKRLELQESSKMQILKAQGAAELDKMKAGGQFQTEQAIRGGQFQTEMAIRQGAADARTAQFEQLQAMGAFTAGELAAKRQQEQDDKSWYEDNVIG